MSKLFKNLKLNTKFTIIIIIIFGLFLAAMALLLENAVDNLIRLTGQQRVREEIEVIKSQLDTAGQELLTATKLIAKEPLFVDHLQAGDEIDIRTRLLVEAAPFALDELDLVDAQGNRLETGLEQGELSDRGEDDLLSLALLSIETTGITQEEAEGDPLLRLSAAVPIKDNLGNIIGGLVASRNMDNGFLARLNFNRTGIHLLLVSQDKIVAQDITHDPDHSTLEEHTPQTGPSFIPALDKAALAQAQQGRTIIADDFVRLTIDSTDHSLAYLPLDIKNDFGAVLIILFNLATLNSFQTELTLSLLVLVAIMSLIAIGLIILFTKRSLITPLTYLATVSHQMAAGNLYTRVEVGSNDEIGFLGQAFNRMAEQLQQTLANLERLVAERTHELTLANSQLRQEIKQRLQTEQELLRARDQAVAASRFKSELLAKVSHELRTPLGAIMGFAELLEIGHYGPVTDKQQQMLRKIIDSTVYQSRIVSELLDQAQLDAGKLKLKSNSFAPTDILTGALTTLQTLAQNKGLTLVNSAAPDLPPTLSGDLARLQQILANLVNNAIKFTDTGRIQVDIYQPDPLHWAMRVSDTGCGIPAEAQERIFEPFGQVDGSVTRLHTGTGLGLSIVKQLTTLMGGQIELASEVGQGSVFTVILPLNSTKEASAPAEG